MPINEESIQCLLCCAENILQCEIKILSTFKNLSLFFKIINEPVVKLDIDSLIGKLSDIFMTSIEDVLDLENKNNLSDFELSKILLLCIVLYIFINNEDDKGSDNLLKLIDNIPKHLHKNASVMFTPFIFKYSEKIPIIVEDLENALMVNDKENQTTYFSPIRERHLSHLDNDRFITAHKKKVHQEMKASQSLDVFNINDSNSSFSTLSSPNTSPLVNLFHLNVKSPTFQGKSLMKTNRELEKNVKQLEHQLYLNTNMETELDRTIQGWKLKYQILEKEMKNLKSEINNKDDLLTEKGDEIVRLLHLGHQNKRLEEKLKDWQDKSNEIQILNVQLEEKCEENKLLKIENRESSHFKALAIDRRLKIENLMVDINNYKSMATELSETKNRLSETESQLMELQNHVQSLQQRNSNIDSLSDMSFNSSYFNPECMSGIVEMERDELKSELAVLKEGTVSKDLYESVKKQLKDLSDDLHETNVQFNLINDDQKNLVRLCQIMKKKSDFGKSEDINNLEFSTTGILKDLKEIFIDMDKSVSHYQEIVFQLTEDRNRLGTELGNILEKEKQLNSQADYSNTQMEEYRQLISVICGILLEDAKINDSACTDIVAMRDLIEETLKEKQKILEKQNNVIDELRVSLRMVETMFSKSVKDLKINFQSVRNFSQSNFQLLLSDMTKIQQLKNDFCRDFQQNISKIDVLNMEIEKINCENLELKSNSLDTVKRYEENVSKIKEEFENENRENKLTIERLKETMNELIKKFNNDRLEDGNAMTKMNNDYEECQQNLKNVSWTYENHLKTKDNEIEDEKRKSIELENKINLMTQQIFEYDKKLEDLSLKLQESNKSILLLESTIEKNAIDYERNKENIMFGLHREMMKNVENFNKTLLEWKEKLQDREERIQCCENKFCALRNKLDSAAELNKDLTEQLELTKRSLSCKIDETMTKQEQMLVLEQEGNRYRQELCEAEECRLLVENRYEDLKKQFDNLSKSLSENKKKYNHLEKELESMKVDLVLKNDNLNVMALHHEKEVEILLAEKENANKEMVILRREISIKNEEIFVMQQNKLKMEQDHRKNMIEKNGQCQSLMCKFEDLKSSSTEIIRQKDDRLKISDIEREKFQKEIDQLILDLSVNSDDLIKCKQNYVEEIKKLTYDMGRERLKMEEELVEIREELLEKNQILEDKNEELKDQNNKIMEIQKLLEENRKYQLETDARNDYLTDIDQKHAKLMMDHSELLNDFEKCQKEFHESNQLNENEKENLKLKINKFEEKERSEEMEKRVKETIIRALESQYQKIEQDLNEMCSEKCLLAQCLSDRSKEIEHLTNQIFELQSINRLKEVDLNDQLTKVSVLEQTNSDNAKTVEILSESIKELKEEINRNVKAIDQKHEEINAYKEKLKQIQLQNDEFHLSIGKLNGIITKLENINKCQQTEIDEIEMEKDKKIESMQTVAEDQIRNLKLLHDHIDNLIKEKECKSDELTKAKEEFNSKVQTLESIIQEEMRNYAKVSEEWKNVEHESHQFKEKYNNMMKKSQQNGARLQETIDQLTNRIHKIEEERDDQIHEMEKMFNVKIFDLQTNLDEQLSEVESVKKEIVESRKLNKTIRANFDLERERLQKASVARENQYVQEKTLLMANLERERLEKLQCKENSEEKIGQLENKMKIDKEQSESELRDTKNNLCKLNEKFKESQIALYRSGEQLKQKQEDFNNEKVRLLNRINELEPLEKKIELLESTSRRLMSKLNELENNENMKEVNVLRSEIKARVNNAAILERDIQELIAKNKALELKIRDLVGNNKNTLREKNEMAEKMSYLQDQVQNLQCLDQTRLDKICNIEKEIDSLKAENESLKSRYLKLREISENHLEKVIITHEETDKNYIERLGSLTKDVEKFQEQIQLLTIKKNMLKEDNCSLKRNVAEINSKFNNLKTVLKERTQNEMRQMSEKYNENSRYTRMSQWVNRPHLNRQLPPVEYLNKESASALGLNPTSKILLESFVFSPYTCEDESSIVLHKDLTKTNNRIDQNIKSAYNDKDRGSQDEIHQITTPLKKRKDGIRYQLTSKIRKSLHLEHHHGDIKSKSTSSSAVSVLSKKGDNIIISSDIVSQTPSEYVSMKLVEPDGSGLKSTTSKPPVMPRKKITAKLESSQLMNIIDLDEFRQRKDKKYLITTLSRKRKKEVIKTEQDIMCSPSESIIQSNPMTFDDTTDLKKVEPSVSICSLFDNSINEQMDLNTVGDKNIRNHNYRQTPIGSLNLQNVDNNFKVYSIDCTPTYSNRSKTPKPSSIIRRLIHKSKAKTPKRKHGSDDKLL